MSKRSFSCYMRENEPCTGAAPDEAFITQGGERFRSNGQPKAILKVKKARAL
jgi:hypothetical protein